jgi:high-affinity Fe2+/Pb2+ permease
VPASDALGFYPTWETMLPQLVLLAVAAAVLWLTVRQQRQASEAASISAPA